MDAIALNGSLPKFVTMDHHGKPHYRLHGELEHQRRTGQCGQAQICFSHAFYFKRALFSLVQFIDKGWKKFHSF